MTGRELIELFERSVKRYHLIGDIDNGVIAGLDLEGRLFTIFNGEIVSRVNPQAIQQTTTRESYLNPGGDGLWPAPEGTCLGYEYATGEWRVPPGLSSARFRLLSHSSNQALIEAEVDLINASGRGIATIFRRDIQVETQERSLKVKVTESIEYIGAAPLSSQEGLLAPWTLSQFDCGPGCQVVFPEVAASEIWDMYEPSDNQRFRKNGLWHLITDGSRRYQVGLSEKVPWIQLFLPEKQLRITRTAAKLPDNCNYIDIIDAPPAQKPSNRGVRYSVYNDSSGFMEIEAAGGTPETLLPGTEMKLAVVTEFSCE